MKLRNCVIATLLLPTVGCGGADDATQSVQEHGGTASTEAAFDGRPTTCGQIPIVEGGHITYREEYYIFRNMNKKLATNPQLRLRTGFAEVTSCEQARTFTAIAQDMADSAKAIDHSPPETDTASTGGIGTTEQGIQYGTESSWNSVVRYTVRGGGGCTGTLLSGHVMLTAAHCIPSSGLYLDFDNDGTMDGGGIDFWIQYDQPVNAFGQPTLYCLTAPSPSAAGVCASSESRLLMARVHPDWTGSDDPGHDVALVIFSGGTWGGPAGTDSAHWRRVNSSGLAEGHDFWAVGEGGKDNGGTVSKDPVSGKWRDWGINSGVLRYGKLANLDWLGSAHFIHNGEQVSTCAGDSGGPAIESKANTVAGVMSNWDSSGYGSSQAKPVPACAIEGRKQRWARISDKISWFNTVLSTYSLPTCSRSGTISGVSYRECW